MLEDSSHEEMYASSQNNKDCECSKLWIISINRYQSINQYCVGVAVGKLGHNTKFCAQHNP